MAFNESILDTQIQTLLQYLSRSFFICILFLLDLLWTDYWTLCEIFSGTIVGHITWSVV